MKFAEFVDIDELRELCESFTALSGAVTAILDLEGNVLVATGWQDICLRFHRVNPQTACRCTESDTVLAGQLQKGGTYNVYKCKNGLFDVAVPIIVGGEHVANFFTGQFLFYPPDEEPFVAQAKEFGFDKRSYLEALHKVPVFSEQQVRTMMEFFMCLARIIGEMGLAGIRREESNRELRTYQEHLELRNRELEQMNKVFVGRELKMVELKERIRELEGKIGA
ncbi:MAG: PocR ligand-binding domain-containing protein [Desulfuromonadaceae bacterium]|nr:PocR ligand-binding domain-containing protein [Desulfuromonadaceae bacterium]MDD5107853.1 PocR ligand-binding domain-containing protein [Desulfuromonadaceae bacterium]